MTSLKCRKLRTGANQEVKGVVIGYKIVTGSEYSTVKVKAFAGCGAFGIGPDHGVQGEERWIVTLVQDSIGIIQIVGVPDGYGGHKIA